MNWRRAATLALSLLLGGCAHVRSLPPGEALTPQERRQAIERAAVWSPTDVAAADLKNGPAGKGAFAPNERVTCEYKKKKLHGMSPKFACEASPGDVLKVKYGALNAEVFGEVLASRLFWALGFPADRMYPVSVRCHGCSNDPKHNHALQETTEEFDPADIERKLEGRAMETTEDSGWKWSELELIGPEAPPDARAQRDALKLLAAFVQHTDSKASNQRLLCPPRQQIGKTGCRQPIMMIQDLGLTFGKSEMFNKNKNSVSLVHWVDVPVWKEPDQCVARLKGSFTGTLSDPEISEAGRAFLAGLLIQLTDDQLHDLFESGRVQRRSADPSGRGEKALATASVDDWVSAFKRKRAEIVDRRCPR